MFDDILNLVKEHLGGHPDVAPALTGDQADAVHTAIANHINDALNNQQTAASTTTTTQSQGSSGGFLQNIVGKVEDAVAGGGVATSAITGSLVNMLTSKFGLPPSVTGAISGALPGILQKIAAKHQASS